MGTVMNWKTVTLEEVEARARDRAKRGGGIQVSPQWLLRLIAEVRALRVTQMLWETNKPASEGKP